MQTLQSFGPCQSHEETNFHIHRCANIGQAKFMNSFTILNSKKGYNALLEIKRNTSIFLQYYNDKATHCYRRLGYFKISSTILQILYRI